MNPYGVNSLIGTAIALPILSIVAVILRFYVRLRVRRTRIGVDDWLVLLSVFLVCGQGAIQVLGATIGVGGRDGKPVDERRVSNQNKLSHSVVVIEKVTYTSIKLSVLFLYRRIFGANISFRKATDCLIVLITLWGLFFLFLESFICVSEGRGSLACAKQEWVLLWFGITEVIGDIAILSLPYPCIQRLHMSRRDKIGVSAIFALGTISTIIGIIRLGYVAKTFHAFFHPEYINKTGPAPGFWTTVEVSIGVIAACLPPLGPLIRKLPEPQKLYSSFRRGLSTLSANKREAYGMQKLDGAGSTAGHQYYVERNYEEKSYEVLA